MKHHEKQVVHTQHVNRKQLQVLHNGKTLAKAAEATKINKKKKAAPITQGTIRYTKRRMQQSALFMQLHTTKIHPFELTRNLISVLNTQIFQYGGYIKTSSEILWYITFLLLLCKR
jgi:hypothetical protein